MTMLLGKKVGMTRVYDEAGRLIPVTVIEAGPCTVTQVKTTESRAAFEKAIELDEADPLAPYVEAVGREHHLPTSLETQPSPVGWCSWYQYFGICRSEYRKVRYV